MGSVSVSAEVSFRHLAGRAGRVGRMAGQGQLRELRLELKHTLRVHFISAESDSNSHTCCCLLGFLETEFSNMEYIDPLG